MKQLPVMLQLYSVRDFAEKDLAGTLAKVKAMGYDYVELAGFYGQTPEALRAMLDANGLQALSAHVGLHALCDADTIAQHAAVGCKYIAIPYLAEEMRPGRPGFDDVLAQFKRVGALCKEQGIQLLYHNHDFEFEKMPDGTFGLDYLYQNVPADLLQTELDVCWVRVAGQNPADYIRKYAGRCPVVHLKDYFKEGETADMYELIGDEKTQNKKPRGQFEFRPVGHGVQDIPAILAAATESGAEWVVVEQDSSVGRTSLEAVQMSREYLQSLGW